jgi:Xaa-Pro aminopeptidase
MFSKETYIQRRKALGQHVGSGVLLFLGNEACGMNYADNAYDFRQDSTFLYYFGLQTAHLLAIINIDEGETIVFGDELTIDDIVWMGNQPGLTEQCERIGVYKTQSYGDAASYLERCIEKGQQIHYLPPYRAEHSLKLHDLLNISYRQVEQTVSVDFIKAVVAQRSIKTSEEIAEIEKACNITADMHLTAMRVLREGMKEWEIVAAVTAVALAAGGRLSFPVIATIIGQTLHNCYYGNTVKEGDMFLLDAGAETAMGYAGDMSSTIPVGKRFTSHQKEIYDIQLASHQAAVNALRPGVPFTGVYDIACKTICEGLKAIGLMKGDVDEAVALGAHAMFFQCGLGHMMGLDVHDMENLGEIWVGYDGQPKSTQFGRKSLRLGRKLEPGFVLTIEPGIYFIPELIDLWKKERKFESFINYSLLEHFRDFGGLRNEEDFLITEDGCRLLGKKIPLTTEEVEQLR